MTTSNGFILNVYELDLTPVEERLVLLPIRIGRSSLNDVCVAHRLVSEFHARIEQVGDRLCVRDLNSKNGVLVEALGSDGAARIAAQKPVDLEPYGFEFLLSPLLRVRVRPANGRGVASVRHSLALGSVLGNAASITNGASARGQERPTEGLDVADPKALAPNGAQATSPAHVAPQGPPEPPRVSSSPPPPRRPSPIPSFAPPTLAPLPGASHVRGAPSAAPRRATGTIAHAGQPASPPSASPALEPYASMFVEPQSGSLALPPLPGPVAAPPPPAGEPSMGDPDEPPMPNTRVSHPSPARHATSFKPSAELPVLPPLAHTAWEIGHGTLPAGSLQPERPAHPVQPLELPSTSIDALALRGLRELAASLMPGQPVESAADVVQLVTKLHDAIEMFCRCFIPVREACSRFIPTEELERAAGERCQNRSGSYLAIEQALEPRGVAAALLDWRNDDQDAPRAVEHILADLMLHHLALSQAAIEGTKALLDELSPAAIDGQQPRSPSMLSRLGLPGARERALWEMFSARHAEFAAAGRSFRELFGEQFSRAYAAHYPLPGSGPSL